jgi:CheY-like chemotaxis protein
MMDVTMPHMDGHEATALLKENPATRHIPVIVVTAHTSNMQIHAAREAGACEVLIKPVNFAALGEMLCRYLGKDVTPLTARTTQDDLSKH